MKKIPQRAKLEKPAPITVKIDPKTLSTGIILPKVSYEVIATVEEEQVFSGMVLPIPRVLVFFLSHVELMLVATIMEDSINYGACHRTSKELARELHVTQPTLTNALYVLRYMGLLLEQPNGKRGNGRLRKINYKALQRLSDLVDGEDRGVFARVRKATRKTNIMNMTKADIHGAYDNYALPPGHDPAEEEEYD